MSLSDLIPDLLDSIPHKSLRIKFFNAEVDFGNHLTIKEVNSIPVEITWESSPQKFYTICLTDPDAPNRMNPVMAERVHWLVGNIPGDSKNFAMGETLFEFVPSCPGEGSGLHRYTFLLYEHPSKLDFSLETKVDTSKQLWDLRRNFSIRKFAKRFSMGDPYAVNYYISQWDQDAQITRRLLGLE